MPSRRTILTRVATLALGGSLAGPGTATPDTTVDSSRSGDGSPDATVLTATVDPAVLSVTGLPTAAIPLYDDLRRRYESVSLADVDRLAGTAIVRGNGLLGGAGTARGSFDVREVTDELQANGGFERAERGGEQRDMTESTGPWWRAERQHDEQSSGRRQDDDSASQVLFRENPATVVGLEPSRLDITHGRGRSEAADHFRTVRQQSATAVAGERSATGLAAALHGDAVAHVTLGDGTRKRLLARLPDAAHDVATVVRATRSVGVAIRGGTDETGVRYALSFDPRALQSATIDDLLADLTASEPATLVDVHRTRGTVVADVSVRSNAVWRVHERLLDNE